MSFSVSCVGDTDAIKLHLVKESERLTGESKDEFDVIRPCLETLLDQEVNNGLLFLEASGHAYFSGGVILVTVFLQHSMSWRFQSKGGG